MTDPNFREIQFGTKQLVFLFMASVVLAVAIFLLGVSVGRGVRGATAAVASTTDVAVGDTTGPVELPAPTTTTANDLSYHDQLQGQPSTAAASDGAKPPVASTPTTSAAAPEVRETTPAPPQRAAETAAKPAASASAGAADVRSKDAGAGWSVQVGAFSSRENADKQVTQLKAKGHPAFVVTASPSRLFHVRVGPFAQRADADRAAAKLRDEGFSKPTVTR